MPSRLYPKLLLEGARLTSKTELCLALSRHPRLVGAGQVRQPSPVISGDWRAFTNLPGGRGLVNFAFDEERRAMEAFATWARLFELLPYSAWLVDQFHLSTQVHQARLEGRRYDFRWLEERLRPQGFRVILCTRSEDSLAAVAGHTGHDVEALLAEQEDFRRAAEDSMLPCLEVDVSHGDVSAVAERIADWLHGTGGLRPPWLSDLGLGTPAAVHGPPCP